jgi:hypothetical protein
MSIICWTVSYQGGPSVSHGVTRFAHAAGRRIRPIVHHASRIQRHVAHVTAQPHRWFKLVCRVIPAALAGSGTLLAPRPATPPYLPVAAPPAFVAPGPTFQPDWNFRPGLPSNPSTGAFPPNITMRTPPAQMPEPSSAVMLLGGVSGLLLLRLSVQRLAYSSEIIQPTAAQTKLLWSSRVA